MTNPPRVEPLEPRALNAAVPAPADVVTWSVNDNGVLVLSGTGGDDRVDVRTNADGVILRLDASGQRHRRFAPGLIKGVTFDGGTGHDSVTLDAYTHTDASTRRVERRTVLYADGAVTDFATAYRPRDGASGGASWLKRFERQKQTLKYETGSTLFVGDSLMERFPTDGPEQWKQLKEQFDAIDAGMSGDTTSSLLYRLDNGLLDGVWPRAVFVSVGTNNVALTDDVAGTVRGIDKVIRKIRDLRPKARIVLSSILPRTNTGDNDKVPAVNAAIARLAARREVTFSDASTAFSDANVKTRDFVQASVHPTRFGYARWLPVIAKSIGVALRR